MRFWWSTRSLLVLATVALVMSAPSGSASTIQLGSVSDEPTRESKRLRDFARYLAVELADSGVEGVDVVVASSMHSMAQMLRDGRVDFYLDSAYPTAVVTRASGGHTVLRRWRGGDAEHRSVVFVRAESPVSSLADLRGKTIALDESFSTASYFLPKAAIAGAGLAVREVELTPPPDVVGYRFTGDDRNSLLWVLRGKAQAGAMSEADFSRLSHRKREELRVVYKTQAVHHSLLSHRDGLDARIVADVKRILLEMHETYVGQIVLSNFEQTTKFDETPGGTAELMTVMRTVGHGLNDELGF